MVAWLLSVYDQYLRSQVSVLARQVWEHVRYQYQLDLLVVRQLRFLK